MSKQLTGAAAEEWIAGHPEIAAANAQSVDEATGAGPTPGPWRVGGHPRDDSGTKWREVLTDAGEFAPSYVCQALEADARLIAAAPDLLAALATSRAWVAQYEALPDHAQAARAMLNVIDAALTSAEGR
jgi:hypothetical protein